MYRTIYLCRQLLLASGLLFAGPVSVTWGANVAFCPGDAFFSSSLTEAIVKSLPDDRDAAEWTLKYSYPKGAGDLGGHAGFQRLTIAGLDAATRDSIARVYKIVRKREPRNVTIRDGRGYETNALPLLVCNSDTNWDKVRIGLKYNEAWMSPPDSATKASDRSAPPLGGVVVKQYVPFVRSVKAVAQDWQHSSDVPPLHVASPAAVSWAINGAPIETPVVAKWDDVQLVILQNAHFKKYFDRTEGTKFWIISRRGVLEASWTEDGFEQRELDPGMDQN